MQFSYYERVFSNGNWCHWLCCMNKNTLRMTFTVWRATYFETEVYMQVCIQNYILSPLFIRVKIDFNMTLTQSFDLIMWFLERISLMESRTVTNLSVMSHYCKNPKAYKQNRRPLVMKLVWWKSRPKRKFGLNRWKPKSMIFGYF